MSFPQFNELPPELKVLIWEHAIEETSRIVEINWCPATDEWTVPYGSSDAIVDTLFHVCQHSRGIWLTWFNKTYEEIGLECFCNHAFFWESDDDENDLDESQPEDRQRATYLAPRLDWLYIGPTHAGQPNTFTISDFDDLSFPTVTRVIVDYMTFHNATRKAVMGITPPEEADLWDWLLHFPSLTTLVVSLGGYEDKRGSAAESIRFLDDANMRWVDLPEKVALAEAIPFPLFVEEVYEQVKDVETMFAFLTKAWKDRKAPILQMKLSVNLGGTPIDKELSEALIKWYNS